MMTLDEVIRVVASTRTDLNKSMLVITAMPGQVSNEVLQECGLMLEGLQSMTLSNLREAVSDLNAIIDMLNGIVERNK